MEYRVESTENTPEVVLNKATGIISIKGVSVADNPMKFFAKMLTEMENYLDNPKDLTTLEFYLHYFNTNTALIFRDLLRKIESQSNESKFVIKWYYDQDDEDMKEVGEEFKHLFKGLHFELIGVMDTTTS